MFTALAPTWFYLLPPILIIGVVALWRGRHYRQRVSSTLLWQGLASEAAGAKSRLIDPLWALILAAALLAALALPHPVVQLGAEDHVPRVETVLQMRALPGGSTAELYVRAVAQENLGSACRLEIAADDGAKSLPVITRDLTPAQLAAGILVPGIPASGRCEIRLRSGSRLAATWSLEKVTRPPYAVLAIGPVSPALQRVMALQPGAVVGDAAIRPAVYLIDDPGFSPGQIAASPGSVIVASARTPLEGITFLDAPATGAATAATSSTGNAATAPVGIVPQFAGNSPLVEMAPGHPIPLGDVRVFHYRPISLSSDWTPLITVDQHPWLAVRRGPSGGGVGGGDVLWVYLASELVPRETNWATDLSFIIFFSNLAAQVGHSGSVPIDGAGVQEWQIKAQAGAGVAALPPRRYDLAPALATAAVVLVVAATALFVRRGRR